MECTMERDEVLALVGKHVRGLEEDMAEYITEILCSGQIDPEEFSDAASPFLLDSGYDDEADATRDLNSLHKAVFGGVEVVAEELLSAPVKMSDAAAPSVNDWMKPKDELKAVDLDELEVAEQRRKERQEKRERREKAKEEKKLARMGIDPRSALTNSSMQRADTSSGCRDIRVEKFSLEYGRLQLIQCADLKLSYARRYGLVGRNGAGKSTLMRHIANRELAIPANMSILHVEQEITGDDTLVVDSVVAADGELMELREEEKRLLANDAKAETSEALQRIYARLEEIDAYTAESRARSILSGLSFTPEMQDTATKEFSGGWRMRVALARALFCKPELLLLDEPTNHLDFHAVIWLENFLQTWPTTLLIVSHQREFLNSVCTDIIHLYNQTLVYYRGNYDCFERVASEKIRLMKRASEAQAKQKAHIQKFIDRFRYNANRAAMAQSRIKKLEKMADVSAVVEDDAVFLPIPDVDPLAPPVLQADDVCFQYEGREGLLFKDVNVGVDMESRVALVGPNGCGKSTLLKLFSGDLQPTSGVIIRNSSLRIATFSQHFVDQLDMRVSALEYFGKKYPSMTSPEIRSHLGKYGVVGDMALRSLSLLSGGQKSRVVFAELFLSQPHILLLDEPSNHLDIETIEGLAQSLSTFNGGVLMVSHDQRLISLVCDDIWQLENGRVKQWKGDLDAYKRYLTEASLHG